MAHLNITFFSESLIRPVQFEMIIPNDIRTEWMPKEPNPYLQRKTKVLFLLHGYTGGAGNWIPEYLCNKYNFAIVMPNGENGFYLDGLSTGHKYGTFVGKELVEYVRKTFNLATCAEDTYIMGMSMGGFGALHTAVAYPENFGKAGVLSGANIVHQIAHMTPGTENGVANYEYYRECFGDLDKVEESACNPEVLIKKLQSEGKKIPEIFMSCGTEDFLLEPNRQLHKWLTENNVPHEYFESKGGHDMIFWNEYGPKFVELMFK